MDYLETRLTRPIRLALMTGLIVAFFVIAPSVVFYTMGFRIDWKEWRILGTGVLSIDVEPSDVRVILNGVLIDKDMPVRLPNLAPANYLLRIEKEGLLAWEKEISIRSRETAYINDIRLLRSDSWKETQNVGEAGGSSIEEENDPAIDLSMLSHLPMIPEKIIALTDTVFIGKTEEMLVVFHREETGWKQQFSLDHGHARVSNQKNEGWYLWSPWEIWRLSKKGEPSLLYRTSVPIRMMIPFEENEFLLATESRLFILDPRYGNEQTILADAHIDMVELLKETGAIQVSGIINGVSGIFLYET